MNGVYRYCPHNHVAVAESLGWINLGVLPGNHGVYCVLMFWPDDAPSKPVWVSA